MQPDGSYRKKETTDSRAVGTHEALMSLTRTRWKIAKEDLAKKNEELSQ
jgi:hypothetical protein